MCLGTYKSPVSGILPRAMRPKNPEAVDVLIYVLWMRTSVSTSEPTKVDVPCEKRITQ